MRTRKSNKVVNTKQVKQLKALEAKTSPTGLEQDPDCENEWSHASKKQQVSNEVVVKKSQKCQTLYERFKLQDLFAEIDQADRLKEFEKTIGFSSKITFLLDLMRQLRKEGHRVLIFSMSKKILNILETII